MQGTEEGELCERKNYIPQVKYKYNANIIMTIIECSNHIMPCTSNTNQVTTMLGQPLSADEVGEFI